MEERVFVFVDGSNLDMATRDAFGKRVDPQCLVEKLIGQRRLVRVHYYEAPLLESVNPSSFVAQQQFFAGLRQNPFWRVRLGRRVQRDRQFTCSKCKKSNRYTTWEQKGVDTLLVLDLVTLATRGAYDVALLVSGDQDFIEPVLEVRMLGKIVENAFTRKAWAPVLQKVSDRRIMLTDKYLNDCWR